MLIFAAFAAHGSADTVEPEQRAVVTTSKRRDRNGGSIFLAVVGFGSPC